MRIFPSNRGLESLFSVTVWCLPILHIVRDRWHWLSRPQNEVLIPLQDFILRSCIGNSIIPGFTPSFWGHERRKQHNKKSLWWKSRFFRSDSISTIYPKSRFCTKRHKRRCFQGFSGFFETFSRNAEKENCKFEHQKCSFVFRSRLRKQACCLGRGFFFAYSEGDIGGWNRLYA